jgi:16S rRNA (cytosine967-C5)-methyltransferase
MARANEPAENALRVNTLRAQPDAVAAALAQQGVAVRRAPDLPEGLIAEGAFDVFGSPQFRAGELLAQSRASMLVARVLAPAAGERVLDLCSAPGGKTTQIAALMGGAGEIVAVERDPKRAAELRETCARLGAAGARIEVRDAAEPVSEGAFDRVLVDPPCSGLGTLQSRPDLRWRATEERIAELVELQARIVARAAEALRPGGVLVYSTCTISAAENEEQIEALLSARRDLELDDLGDEHPELSSEGAPRCLQLLPDRDLTDGFFIARLRRAAA